MTRLKNFSLRQPSWLMVICLINTLGFFGCAEISSLMNEVNTVESEENVKEQAAREDTMHAAMDAAITPPPTIEEVEEAIASTKTLLDDQQQQIGELLSLRGEVKQTLREFHDQNLAPMNAAVESLQHQVGGWEDASATNQATLSSVIESQTQDLEQAQVRVGVYGEQVTALVDQIDQNNRQYEKLLTAFQDSLVGFKGTMAEFNVTLKAEKQRATQKEGDLANRLNEQQQTIDQALPKAKDILDFQKRLNQLHVYINQVRDTLTSDTTALQAAVKNMPTDNLQDVIISLEQRYQQLAQAPSFNPALTEHLATLERRVEQSEQYFAETVKGLHDGNQEILIGRHDGDNTQETEKLQALVTSLEERYQQLAQAPSSNPTLTEHLQALERRVEKSEQHYAETVKSLHDDIREISAGMQTDLKTQETEKLQTLVTSLEQRYQQLAHNPSSNPALTKHIQALEQRVGESEIFSATSIKALQHDVKIVSDRMATLTQSIGAEAVEALHHDIQEVSAGMLELAQTISLLEKTKIPTNSIKAGSISEPQSRR